MENRFRNANWLSIVYTQPGKKGSGSMGDGKADLSDFAKGNEIAVMPFP